METWRLEGEDEQNYLNSVSSFLIGVYNVVLENFDTHLMKTSFMGWNRRPALLCMLCKM